MSNFDWYSEEEVGWDEEVKPARRARRPLPPTPHRWRRWLLLALILVMGLGTAVTLITQRLSQRVEEVSYALEADIRDSYGVVYQSALDGDRDLFVTFLSGRNAAWAGAQERVIANGLFYDRPGFGLQWLPQDAGETITAVTISPDLTTAIVTATHQYALDVGNSLSQTIFLQHTAVYRLGPDRWLISPADQEFWGETETSKGARLTLTYPQRDRAIANRLATDLEAKIHELCTRLADLTCPAGLHVNVALSANPAAVFESNQLPAGATMTLPRMRDLGWYSFPARLGEHTLTLPTPSLLGRPLDEAGYQAIYRGYAARVASAVIAEQVGWQCCDGAALFQALLDAQLAQLGLKPWPVTAVAYESLAGSQITAVYQTWRNAPLDLDEDRQALYLMVEFLQQVGQVTPATMQRALVSMPAEEAYPSLVALERDWRRYLYGRSPAAQTSPPIPWSQQALWLVCRPDAAADALLYRYDVADDDLELVRALGREAAVLQPLMNHDAVLIGEIGAGTLPFASTFLWQDGRERLIDRQPGMMSVATSVATLPLALSPDGANAVFLVGGRASTPYALLNLDACRNTGECALSSLLGRPIWSPDGQQTILVGSPAGSGADVLLFRAAAQGQQVEMVGTGQYPFWLDNDTIAYLEARAVVAIAGADSAPTTALLLDEVLALAQVAAPDDWQLQFISVNPQDAGMLLLVLANVGIGDAHLLAYHQESGDVTVRLSWAHREVSSMAQAVLSPDGRWLALLSFADQEQGWILQLHDLAQDSTRYYQLGTAVFGMIRPSAWSADGQWLALAHDGDVRLFALDAAYERRFAPERMMCDQAVWGGSQ
ncbi:MAG: hypothetical protein IAE79_02345 [Anaerolinea sp.]|nr:hypothetical protein [Anaerolinea sp.]